MPKVVDSSGKTQSKDIAKSSVPSGPVATDKSGSITISVHAKPGSKQNAVTGMLEVGRG
uniref:Uncharacterized protein n=1 Tax=Podarcis muralis TaxID=64176 RepID=A0A670JZG3_PODMU